MKTSTTAGWIVGAVIVIAILGWAFTRATNPATSVSGDQNATSSATSSGTVSSGGSGTHQVLEQEQVLILGEYYANVPYGFTFSYPRSLTAQTI
jgi:hypothetical protein